MQRSNVAVWALVLLVGLLEGSSVLFASSPSAKQQLRTKRLRLTGPGMPYTHPPHSNGQRLSCKPLPTLKLGDSDKEVK